MLSHSLLLLFNHEIDGITIAMGIDERNARRYLTRLADWGYLNAEGENKNKKYKITHRSTWADAGEVDAVD